MKILVALLTLTILTSCMADNSGGYGENNEPTFVAKATVLELGDKILVDVYEAEYASGSYLVIIPEGISIVGKSGENLTRGDIKVGNRLEITYNGQVMLSYPAQIVAHRVVIK